MLQIEIHPQKGRCYVAQSNICKGQTVLEAAAFARCVDQESRARVCSYCVKEPKSKEQKNKSSCYCGQGHCSEECAKNDVFHTLVCSSVTL
jgi:hypothetical protein